MAKPILWTRKMVMQDRTLFWALLAASVTNVVCLCGYL